MVSCGNGGLQGKGIVLSENMFVYRGKRRSPMGIDTRSHQFGFSFEGEVSRASMRSSKGSPYSPNIRKFILAKDFLSHGKLSVDWVTHAD